MLLTLAARQAYVSAFIAVAVGVCYLLAARLGLALLERPDGVAVFWPAAGLASGILIAAGPALRWPVVIGVMTATIAANLLGDRNASSSILFAVSNASEALLVAGLIGRFCNLPFELNNLWQVLSLFVAATIGTAVSGIGGTLGFVLFHTSTASTLTVWRHWFASDALGIVTVAPLLIGLASFMRDIPTRREIAEGALALAVVSALCGLFVFLPNQPWIVELAMASLSPLFLWIAARLRPAFTAVSTFICAITIVSTTTFGIGIFGDSTLPIEQRILSAQAAILGISFGALVLASLFSERRHHETTVLDREARLQEALRAGGVMAFDWNVPADEMHYSRNARQILGLELGEIVSRTEFVASVHPDDRPRLKDCLTGVRPDSPSYSLTFRYMRPDGREVWLEETAIVEFDAAGHAKRIQGLTADITDQKRFEQELSLAQKSAELADRAKSSFLAAASHDLRQPLQTIRFLQGAVEQRVEDGEARKLLGGIGRSLDTMSSMLSSLLDINRLESGNLRPSTSDFAINDLFDSVQTDFRRAVEERGLQWRLVRSALIVRSDRRMLEEMIRNLLSNAIRYTDRGKVLLGCRRARDKVHIEVWDSGVGIMGDQLPHVFEEYYRGSEGVERGGLGLGLAIVKRLAEILDHKVDVSSTPGKGTGFSIEVPQGQAHATAPQSIEPPDQDEVPFLGTILVIEDEISVRKALGALLKARGVRATTVATGNDAVTLINQQGMRPDLILSDYNLPGSMNGVETIKALRAALDWRVPAIVMTGDIRSKTIEAVALHGVSVLVKPFTAEELLQLIKRLHHGSMSHDHS